MPETLEKAKQVPVHDDGPCLNGQLYTPLVSGFCLVCGYAPDMQSIAIILQCPIDGTKLDTSGGCTKCGHQFDISRD